MLRRLAPALLLGLIATLAAPLPTGSPAHARNVRSEGLRLSGASAQATVEGRLSGDDLSAYTVYAREGQTLHIGLRARGGDVRVVVQAPLASRTLAAGQSGNAPLRVLVRETGIHRIALLLTDASRQTGNEARYVLRVSYAALKGAGPEPDRPDRPDDDGNVDDTGGPDYWRVQGLGGNLLAVRSGPGAGYPILAQLPERAVVANRGCRGRGADRWCRIEVEALRLTGWSSGRFLTEHAGRPGRPQEDVSNRPEGPFDARGELPCAARRDDRIGACAYLLKRDRGARVRLWVETRPDRWRLIRFENGLPTDTDASTPMEVALTGPLFRISVGSERYEVPTTIVRPR